MNGNGKKLIALGATVAAAAMTVGVSACAGGSGSSGTASGYCADMPDAIGLYAGNPVTQMGFKVGTVDSVEPDGDHVRVTFSLADDRNYPMDVKAVTRSKSLLADRSLELVGNYQEGPELTPGVCISREDSFTPKSISEIAGSAADFIEAVAPKDGDKSLETAVANFELSLNGQGENARELMVHAAAASRDPNQVIADFGTSIQSMAPLTDEALQHWSTFESIFDQLPTIVDAGIELWPGPTGVATGVGWVLAVLLDIQTKYGAELWPLMHGPVTDAIHLAATRSSDLAELLDSIPSVAATMRQQTVGSDGLSISYQVPEVQLVSGISVPMTDLLTNVLAEGR